MGRPLTWNTWLTRLTLIAILMVVVAPPIGTVAPLWAENGLGDGPTKEDRKIVRSVVRVLKKHVSQAKLDDERSRRCLKNFVESLDPLKLYFLQSDIDEFYGYREHLDDMVKKENLEFPYLVFRRYLERIDERVTVAETLLLQKHDFTVAEEIIIDPDYLGHCKTPEEATERWRKRIKLELLRLRAAATETEAEAESDEPPEDTPSDGPEEEIEPHPERKNDPVSKLQRRYRNFKKRMHQIDHLELLEMFLTALAMAYDPHSRYMSPKTLENFQIAMRLELEGIGAVLEWDLGYTLVKEIIAGGAAHQDGRLKPGDKIVGVGEGERGEIVDVVDQKLSDVVPRIRGKRGSVVRLLVEPAGSQRRKIYRLERDRVQLKDSEAQGKVIEQPLEGTDRTCRIGFINLPSFYRDMAGAERGEKDFKSTTKDVQALISDFKEQGIDALIIDLRSNPGGALREAIDLTGLFIDTGTVVHVKDRKVVAQRDNNRGTAWDGPLVVLTNKLSASASEIFAGAIQDYRRGIVVGDRTTHGKGTVQRLIDIGGPRATNMGVLKLTTQQYYLPGGNSTQNVGVHADIELPSLLAELDIGEAELDYALPFDKVDPAETRAYTTLGSEVLPRIAARSADRRARSEEFQKLERRIDRYKRKLKYRVRVSLREADFLAERAEADADDHHPDDDRDDNDRIDPDNYYVRETLAITADYFRFGPWGSEQTN